MTEAGDGRRPIRRLSAATVERIAAGEVVERPASVVKELVENALDADATSIVVRLQGGGIDRVEVADDGSGVPPEELPLAVERHATSKLDPEGPVERIASLGFRGEALAAIGSVARLRILSRTGDREGAEGISVVGGEVVGRFSTSRAPGTTVEVEDLFFATPARRKFLKSPPAEQVEVLRTLERIYLAHPTVTLRLETEGAERGVWPATSSLRDAAATVLGAPFLDASFRVSGPIPGGHLFGEVGRPAAAAPTSGSLYLGVNGRAVASRPLAQAVRAAFGDALPRSRFPTGVLHLELDPDSIDVNVHPTKREIRFSRERELAEAIRLLVRGGLLGTPLASEVVHLPDRLPSDLGPHVRVGVSPASATGSAGASAGQRTLDGAAPAREISVPTVTGHGGRFTLLGALDALYWVAATEDGIALIDQHAASERLLFETLRSAGVLGRQVLVEPVTVELSAAQRSAWAANADAVRSAGFELDAFGPTSVRVRAVPSYRARFPRPEAIRDLLDELSSGGRPTLPDGLVERTSATIACHAAIRAGDTVEAAEIVRLVAALDTLPDRVRTCPHGRPIFIRISRSRLDRWFLRSGA